MDDWLVSSVLICGWRDLKSKGGILDIVSFSLVSIFSSLVIKMAREDLLLLLLLLLLLGGDVLHRGYGSGRVIGYSGCCCYCCGGIAVAVAVMVLEIYSSVVAQVVAVAVAVVVVVVVAVVAAVAVALEIVMGMVLRKMVALVVVQCGYMIVIVCRL